MRSCTALAGWILLLFPSVLCFAPVTQQRQQKCRRYYTQDDSNPEAASLVWASEETSRSSSLIPTARPLTLWNDEDDDAWKEWHYSFSRNGFTDFLPQFSDHKHCLIVGDNDDRVPSRLPWEEEISRQFQITTTNMNTRLFSNRGSDDTLGHHDVFQATEATPSSTLASIDTLESHNFDCIIDRGLANAILMSDSYSSSEDARWELQCLLQAAHHAIAESGIYVMLTHDFLSPEIQDYLQEQGKSLGMEWKFHLDGISNPGMCVSVARKFFSGTLPSVGRLAKKP